MGRYGERWGEMGRDGTSTRPASTAARSIALPLAFRTVTIRGAVTISSA